MKKIFCFKIFILAMGLTFSQQQSFESNYVLSTCKGKIPREFTVNIIEKSKNDFINDSTLQGYEKNKLKSFYENSNYFIQRFLTGGKVLFGDEMTNYVNKVAKNLLVKSGNEELIGRLKFYVLRSNVVNAICMPDGSIFVTVGLLSQIENEGQLAFVIGHEITHYLSQHGKEAFIELEKLKSRYNRGELDFEGAVTSLSAHSRSHEIEADDFGYKMCLKAGYSSEEAEKVLLVLQYSHLPFDEKKFDPTFFNSESYKIPSTYFDGEEKFSSIVDDSEIDDSKASHPNIKTRIDNVNKKKQKSGKENFFPKADFKYINTKARFENQYLNILNRQYVKAVYESFLLKNNFPNNKYLNECIAKSLYSIAKQIDNSIVNERNDSYKQGNSLGLFNLFYKKFSSKEMIILALKSMVEMEDSSYSMYIEDLIFDLYHNHLVNFDSFEYKNVESKLTDSARLINFIVLDSIQFNALSKIEKIKYIKKKKIFENKNDEIVKNSEENYMYKALYNVNDPSYIENIFNKVKERNKERYFEELSYEKRQEITKNTKKKATKFKEQTMDSILILSIEYSSFNTKGELNTTESFELKNETSKIIQELTSNSAVHYKFMGIESFDSLTTQEINDNFILNEWKDEMTESYSEKMLSLTQNRADEVFDRLGYNNVMLINFFNTKNPKTFGEKAIRGIFFPVLIGVPGVWPLLFIHSRNYTSMSYIQIIDSDGYTIFYRKYEGDSKPKLKNDELFLNDVILQIVK